MQAKMIPVPNGDGGKQIANQLEENADFQNRMCAIAGEDVRNFKPKQNPSLIFNYKNYSSIALCDTEYLLTYVDIESKGIDCDSNIFEYFILKPNKNLLLKMILQLAAFSGTKTISTT